MRGVPGMQCDSATRGHVTLSELAFSYIGIAIGSNHPLILTLPLCTEGVSSCNLPMRCCVACGQEVPPCSTQQLSKAHHIRPNKSLYEADKVVIKHHATLSLRSPSQAQNCTSLRKHRKLTFRTLINMHLLSVGMSNIILEFHWTELASQADLLHQPQTHQGLAALLLEAVLLVAVLLVAVPLVAVLPVAVPLVAVPLVVVTVPGHLVQHLQGCSTMITSDVRCKIHCIRSTGACKKATSPNTQYMEITSQDTGNTYSCQMCRN